MAQISLQSLQYVVNHVILPPQLPSSAESSEVIQLGEQYLLQIVLQSVQELSPRSSNHEQPAWASLEQTLRHWRIIQDGGTLSTELLICWLADTRPNDVVSLVIKAQNASLIMRIRDDGVVFETFELSPRPGPVIDSKTSLRRSFPSAAVFVPKLVFDNDDFRKQLVATLRKLDLETVEEMVPKATKAGKKTAEVRDTAHPGLVTEMLMALLASLGKPIQATQIHKRCRDDAVWDATLLPWRRSSLWLAIRVTLQTSLSQMLTPNVALTGYKNIMLVLLTKIMQASLLLKLPMDLCSLIQAKIARRSCKLGTAILDFVYHDALAVGRNLKNKLEIEWQGAQAVEAAIQTKMHTSSIEKDTSMTLTSCGLYLDVIVQSDDSAPSNLSQFAPDCPALIHYRRDNLPNLSSHYPGNDEMFALANLEIWVANDLAAWTAHAKAYPLDDHCSGLASLALDYKQRASSAYVDSPEQLSVMLLTIAELWLALDTVVTRIIPLLLDFLPELPDGLFYPLLLAKREHMVRLKVVEDYIANRRRHSNPRYLPIFSDPINPSTPHFSSLYYNNSSKHKELRRSIEADATEQRDAKKVEWESKQNDYNSLKAEAAALSCTKILDDWGDENHDPTCKKCRTEAKAKGISIGVHEWPLPEKESQCQAAVFELDCPSGFVAWRNLTWMIVHDLGRGRSDRGAQPADTVSNYSGLKDYRGQELSRITLASDVKSFIKAHYSNVKFPQGLSQLYVKNALRYLYYDREFKTWISEETKVPNFAPYCNSKLSNGPHRNLQYAVDSTVHHQAKVMADQEICSKDLTLHELIAFGSLRADGEMTQWLNIQRELGASNLTLNSDAVCVLIIQAATQVGNRANTELRLAHGVLESTQFCVELLVRVDSILTSIRTNWKSDNAMILVIVVITRIINLTTDEDCRTRALEAVHTCREIISSWIESLNRLLESTNDGPQVQRIQRNLLKLGLIGKSSYGMDSEHLKLSLKSAEDVRQWTFFSIMVHDNTPGSQQNLPMMVRRLLLNDKKLSYEISTVLPPLLSNGDNPGLDQTVQLIWSDYKADSSQWTLLSPPNERWLQKATSLAQGHRPQTVSYNFLEGELLVSGRPLGRLPPEYNRSELYVRMFGSQIFHVFASNMHGMLFMTARSIEGHQIHFGRRDGEFIIRLRKGTSIWEAVPHGKLRGDFPSFFVNDFLHWLDLTTNILEFRPVNELFGSSTEWQLHYKRRSPSFLRKGNRKLVDVRSKTVSSINHLFSPIEVPSYIHVTTSSECPVDIDLPRLGLRFFLNQDGHLECRELRKIIDPDQHVGTLIGLQSKMVLCERGKYAPQLDRIVIVPAGLVSVSRRESHVAVSISSTDRHVNYLRFQVDSILGRLRGVGGLHSWLFQAYLHALTSNILPDPLTGRTGTEEALSIVKAQIKQTWKPLDDEEAAIVDLLAALTPRRTYYPQHLQVMQQVKWSPELSFMAQHDDFAPLCARLVESGNRFGIFYTKDNEIKSLQQPSHPHLLQRARLRHSAFRSSQFGVGADLYAFDKTYLGRDRSCITDRGLRTYQIAALIAEWPSSFEASPNLAANFRRWGAMSGFGKVFDTSRSIVDLLQVAYPSSWAPLRGLCCRLNQDADKYRLLFTFAIIAYGKNIGPLEDLRTLLAFAFLEDLRQIQLPPHDSCDLSTGSRPQEATLAGSIKDFAYGFSLSRKHLSASERRQEHTDYQRRVQAQANTVAKGYMAQWPTARPVAFTKSTAPSLKAKPIHGSLTSRFAELMRNREMEAYLSDVQAMIDGAKEISSPVRPKGWQATINSTRSYEPCVMPNLASLLSIKAPKFETIPQQLYTNQAVTLPVEDMHIRHVLSNLMSRTTSSCPNAMRQRYKADLEDSLDAFLKHEEPIEPKELPYDLAAVKTYFDASKKYVNNLYRHLHMVMEAGTPLSVMLCLGCLWPRVTIIDLLGLLAPITCLSINENWTDFLLQLGRSISLYQRSRRLLLAAEAGNLSTFFSEVQNLGRMGWDPKQYPDWLLVEIENDLLIRPIQARVAQEVLQPKSLNNMLTQLNMGEGKSSVIVPIVACAIANGKNLSRVLVLKSLTTQMMDTLARRLGGLVGRQIYYMPFSRKTPVNETVLCQLQVLYNECIKSRGILLMQPEFLLSFKLMGIERLTSGDHALSTKLLEIQGWLDRSARDLLDESDEILDVKFQLIYTIGNQRHIDGQSERWLLTQSVFDLIDKHITALATSRPDEIEITRRSDGSFPTIRLLSSDVGLRLNAKIAGDVIESKLPGLNLETWNLPDQGLLYHFLLNKEVGEIESMTVAKHCREDESLMKRILLIRGLIAHRIILFVLSGKRWSVNFGQHPSRCLVAVPYRAKGVPAATAEFGHPDVTILLTCLTYYYAGLTDVQMRICFELLQKADDPSLEYQNWIQRSKSLPPELRNWNSINLEDEQQCYNVLFPALKYSKKVADFYMANVVFPREAKEFDQKLSTSGWDIPLQGKRLTTGFSGTNDNRFLLPSSISQQDLLELRHTSGKVLNYVTRPENLGYDCAKDKNGRQLSAEGLLQFITRLDGKARILIDVGAQVLETANKDVVKDWIRLVDDADAGIFFNADDKIMVVARDSLKAEPFATSSFSSRIDRCLVYMDEVHTRGTDLKLPRDARAVVTLGPRLTKDRLVQACMRLRQLGHGQSVHFIAPPEVHRDILKVIGKSESHRINGYDVVSWALAQSCLNIEKNEPLRIMQGLSYHRRQKAAQQYQMEPEDGEILEHTAAEMFIEKEEQSLSDLYAPPSLKPINETNLLKVSSQNTSTEVQALLHRWSEIDPNTADGANVQEEHEREVAHEVEQEIEIQRPPPAKPLKEVVDARLKAYIQNGTSETWKLFQYADKAIVRESSAGKKVGPHRIWTGIRVSDGFRSTVEKPVSGFYDDYFGPVNWVLTNKGASPATELLIISQYEVNQLFADITSPSSAVFLHNYEPRVARAMSSVDSSTVTPLLQSTQNWLTLGFELRCQLHLFAGQLYINTYKDYLALRKSPPSTMVNLAFLKEWIGIRRRGQNYSQTHIGRMVAGWNLQEEDFE